MANGLRVRAVGRVNSINFFNKKLELISIYLGHGHSDSAIWCDNEQAVVIFLDGVNRIININLTTNTIQVLYFFILSTIDLK